MTKTNILSGSLDLALLADLDRKPALFDRGEPLFWDDPHVSKQMLDAHLNPDWDAASRNHALIDQQVEWIANQLPLSPGARLIDLGCGPGLYCSRLARLGYRVTGMDYSRRSIDYALIAAHENKQAIEYIYQDYLMLDRPEQFDAAIMVYYDLGVLSDPDRDNLLKRVYRALRPGGYFVFDLLTSLNRPKRLPREWAVKPEGGFWRPGPHVVFSQSFSYPEADAFVDQYIVVEPTGDTTIYRNWEHCYTPETIAPVLATVGFEIEGIWADLTGREYHAGDTTLAIVARRKD
ncbi:MAG: class I SAM-dependent methyltransferase [Bacillota bacterium]